MDSTVRDLTVEPIHLNPRFASGYMNTLYRDRSGATTDLTELTLAQTMYLYSSIYLINNNILNVILQVESENLIQ